MLLPLSSSHTPHLEFLPECASTNSALVARATAGAPQFSVLATDTQTAGRGRLGRTWVAPPGMTLAVSVLLRPGFGCEGWGWLPLVAGLAMARAVREQLPRTARVGVKWPNDVLVGERKVCGVLTEVAPGEQPGVVVGAGVNLTIPRGQLPTETATSMTLEGAEAGALLDRTLAAYLRELGTLVGALEVGAGDATASGIRGVVSAECVTLGRKVRVSLPGDETFIGVALEIDPTGRLVVDGAAGRIAVAAGDVTHVRYE